MIQSALLHNPTPVLWTSGHAGSRLRIALLSLQLLTTDTELNTAVSLLQRHERGEAAGVSDAELWCVRARAPVSDAKLWSMHAHARV